MRPNELNCYERLHQKIPLNLPDCALSMSLSDLYPIHVTNVHIQRSKHGGIAVKTTTAETLESNLANPHMINQKHIKVTTFLSAASSSTTTLSSCKETVKTEKMNVDA